MAEEVFSAVSVLALIAWAGLAAVSCMVSGRAQRRILVLSGRVVPLLLCMAYSAMLAMYRGTTDGDFSSLAGVLVLLGSPGKMLGAWSHFLAFDLLVGHWQVTDALRTGRSRLPLLLGLPVTCMYGPLGLLVYLALRWMAHRPTTVGNGTVTETPSTQNRSPVANSSMD